MVSERRRHLRHKVHSPAYASLGSGIGGIVLDANERGAAVQSLTLLAPQSFVDLRLDLLDTRGSAVTPARVAWCDGEGRAGLEFLNLTGESRRQLQQWLLLNALLATENSGRLRQTPQAAPAAMAQQPQAVGDPAFLQLTEQALACTAADGAALALADGAAILCRATAGKMAPPPGTKLEAESGISGACVRSGRWLRCDDPELDPHVDRESCRVLGINSILAVPIGERGAVLGLIEVFSRSPYAFKEAHCAALQELARLVARSLGAGAAGGAPPAETPQAPEREQEQRPEAPEAEPPVAAVALQAPPAATPSPPSAAAPPAPLPGSATVPDKPPASGKGERVLLLGVLALLLVLGGWFVLGRGPAASKDVSAAEVPAADTQKPPRVQLPPVQVPPKVSAGDEAALPAPVSTMPDSLRALRRRAQAGDAEAQFELGARLASGDDVAQDYAQAVKWFNRAADGGQVLAAATLGAYYWAGRGVPQDDVSAYMWSSIAKEGGDEASKYRLAILRSRMSAAEISAAERRAAAWRQLHLRQHLASSTAE